MIDGSMIQFRGHGFQSRSSYQGNYPVIPRSGSI